MSIIRGATRVELPILQKGNHGNQYNLNCKKPDWFGNGRFMTIAVLAEYRVTDINGIIDIEKTVQILKNAENLLDGITK